MTLNAIGGIGMISVGVLGGPFLGALQDHSLDRRLALDAPALHQSVTSATTKTSYLLEFRTIDKVKEASLPPADAESLKSIRARNNQATLAQVAVLPCLMFLCYLGLILFFRRRGGYRPVDLPSK